FTSNHDENTYWGTEYEKYGVAAIAMAVFSCTWPGIPLIYSGQEKPNVKRLAFFEKDFIDWEGDVTLNDFYHTLLQFRKKNKALQENASVLILATLHSDVLVYLCRRQQDKVLVCLNLSKEKADFKLDHPALPGNYNDLFSDKPLQIKRRQSFTLAAGEFKVYHISSGNMAW
ncbi:MAG: alpha-glucosidase C-terminal domain-containing protein, partial [Bacteroidota bacterium]